MAQTYSNVPVLSKLKIGNQTYFLKDADARAILDAINANVYTSLQLDLGTVDAGGSNLVTAGNIKEYVDQAVAVGIKVVVDEQAQGVEEPATTASKSTMGKIYLVQIAGTTAGTYTEFITLDKGSSATPRYVWEKIGTTDTDLSGYVTDVSYANGTLSQTKDGQSSTVHTFGAFADADEGTATYTPAGNVTVNELTQTATSAGLTKADYTPEGTIDSITVIDSVGQLPSKDSDTWDAGTLPEINYSAFSGGSVDVSYTSEGSVEVTGGDVSVNVSLNAGTLPTFDVTKFNGGSKTSDSWNAGTLPTLGEASTGTFATEGVVVNVDTTDSEMLVFTSATPATAVTAQGTFSQGTLPSFVEGSFTSATIASDIFDAGSFPTVDESETYATVNSIEVSYSAPELSVSYTAPAFDESEFFSAGQLPSFEEGAFSQGSLPTTKNVTPTFTGSTVASALVTGVTYDKASANGGSFAGTQASITVTPKASE